MLGGYIWTVLRDGDHDVLNVHIYASASRTIEMQDGQRAIVQMRTQLPWQPGVKISVTVPPDSTVRINLPVPKWADNFRVSSGFDSNLFLTHQRSVFIIGLLPKSRLHTD